MRLRKASELLSQKGLTPNQIEAVLWKVDFILVNENGDPITDGSGERAFVGVAEEELNRILKVYKWHLEGHVGKIPTE